MCIRDSQYSLWHEVYETTGYDARKATYRNGTFIAEDGTCLLYTSLIIILLKAGLSLDLNDLKKVGRPAPATTSA